MHSRRSIRGMALTLALVGPMIAAEPAGERGARPRARVIDRIVAVVNTDVILLSELQLAMAQDPRVADAFSRLGPAASPSQIELVTREAERRVLDDLIDRQLLLDEAKRFGILATDRDVDAHLQRAAIDSGLANVAELRAAVEEAGIYGTWGEFRAQVRDELSAMYVVHELARASVTESQVREYYRKMSQGEDSKVEAYAFEVVPADGSPAARDEALELARQTARRLTAGEDPERIAEELEQDPDPILVARNRVPPSVETTLFAARPGEVVGPFASGAGFRIYRVVRKVDSDLVPYEQARGRIRAQLEAEAEDRAREELFRQLRSKAHIDRRL